MVGKTGGEAKSEVHSAAATQLEDRVVGEIGSLRTELAEIRELLSRGHSLERAVEEYRYLPPGPTSFRWGFVGVWRGGRNSAHSVYTTTTEEEYFDHPDACPANVAALAAALSNPHTVALCVHLFRKGASTREELQTGCSVSEAELEAAVAPLLEWRYVRWHEGKLAGHGPGLCTQGLNFVVTLVGMARHSVAERERRAPDGAGGGEG
jgi:hypothetical protein